MTLDRAGDQTGDTVRVGHIGRDGASGAACGFDEFHRLAQLIRAASCDDGTRAFAGEGQGRGAADSAAAAGDQGHLVREVGRHDCFSLGSERHVHSGTILPKRPCGRRLMIGCAEA
jgi:hypothetical protein